jgi:hypothetical protein
MRNPATASIMMAMILAIFMLPFHSPSLSSVAISNCKCNTGSYTVQTCPCGGGNATGCSITFGFKQCDDTNGSILTNCFNSSCAKQNCSCSGQSPNGSSNGFTIEWCNTCPGGSIVTVGYECSGCGSLCG